MSSDEDPTWPKFARAWPGTTIEAARAYQAIKEMISIEDDRLLQQLAAAQIRSAPSSKNFLPVCNHDPFSDSTTLHIPYNTEVRCTACGRSADI